ncbi:MAG: hypothetical protein KBT03_04710 [Bacteroidales bacterium]|nr:hypothetical protein [Candidatus Scybalousia scybalohippi]
MEMKDYEELEKRLCKHLEEISSHKSFDMGDIEAIDKISHSLKSIGYVKDNMYGKSSYGRGGMWNAQGSYGGMYPSDMYHDTYMGDAYGREGTHYVRGHYSRANDIEGPMQEMLKDPNISSNDRAIIERAMEIARKH